jgi:hypothetical protein
VRPRIADPRSDMSQDERDAPAAADGPRGAAPGTCHAEPPVCGMVPAAEEEIPLGSGALRLGRILSRSGCVRL